MFFILSRFNNTKVSVSRRIIVHLTIIYKLEMSKKKKINKISHPHQHKREKKSDKKDHETFVVGEEM